MKLNLPSFSESRMKSKVKDHLPSYLSQITSSLIKIYLKEIDYLDRTSIFSESNSSNKFNFYYFLEFAKKFASKEINYGEIIDCINSSSNLATRLLTSNIKVGYYLNA